MIWSTLSWRRRSFALILVWHLYMCICGTQQKINQARHHTVLLAKFPFSSVSLTRLPSDRALYTEVLSATTEINAYKTVFNWWDKRATFFCTNSKWTGWSREMCSHNKLQFWNNCVIFLIGYFVVITTATKSKLAIVKIHDKNLLNLYFSVWKTYNPALMRNVS